VNKLQTTLFLFFFILSTLLNSAEIKILAPFVPNLVEYNKKGIYQKIIHEAAKKSGVSFQETVYPTKRAVSLFDSKKATCMYLFSDISKEKHGKDKIITSPVLGVAAGYIFTRKGEKPISSFDQLKGKSVGAILGPTEYFTSFVKRNIKIDYAPTTKMNLKKLEIKRIDFIIGFLPDLTPNLPHLSYNKDFPFVVIKDKLTCHDNNEGRLLIEKISPAIDQMKKSGRLKEILGKLYFELD